METSSQSPPISETFETPGEIAKILRTTPQTINTWHRRGIIPARIRIGRVVRFDRADVIAALEARSRTEAAAAGAGQ